MATKSLHRAAKAHSRNRSAAPPAGYSDATADRIRAYVASMRPRAGVVYLDDEIEESIRRGHALVERLAQSASGEDLPTLPISLRDCADVIAFIESVDPIERRTWWSDPEHAPSHVCGFLLLLHALERSLRELEPAALSAAEAALNGVIAMTPPEREEFARAFKRRLRNVRGREGVRS